MIKNNSNYYLNLFKKYGESPKSLGWSKGKQFLRYDQLTRDCTLKNSSFLDVGCGFGDFASYLKIQKYWKTINYLGIDLIDEFLNIANKNHPERNFRFSKEDFLDTDLNEKFDYVISSGVFNLKNDSKNQYNVIKSFIEKMLCYSKKSISIDFLSDKVEYGHEHSFHSNPSKILSLAYEFSKNISLSNDYFPFEYTLRINKDDNFDKETAIFNSLQKR